MSILNEPSDGTLSILLALRGAVRAYGDMPRQRLLALCAPATLGTNQDLARFTLERWIQLGVFRDDSAMVALRSEFATDATDDIEVLRAALLQLVLRAENNGRILDEDSDGADAASLASDFSRAACWCLLQDPYAFVPSFKKYVERRQIDQDITAVQNATRWTGFVRWSTFLGVAMKTSGGILLNPAFAVRVVLDKILPPGSSLELGAFIDHLVTEVPVLPGGPLSARVAAKVKSPWREFGPHEVAPTTALALMQLHEAGQLQLRRLSDAGVRVFLGRGGKAMDEFTHVEKAE